MPGATSSFLLLVAMPFVPSSFLPGWWFHVFLFFFKSVLFQPLLGMIEPTDILLLFRVSLEPPSRLVFH